MPPQSESQRRFAFAEVSRRKKGLSERGFKSMGTKKLEEYAHEPLHNKKKKGRLAERE